MMESAAIILADLGATLRPVSLVAASLALAEVTAWSGSAGRLWMACMTKGALDRFGVDWACGLLIWGTALAGLALVGLFSHPTIVAAIVMLAIGGGRSMGRSRIIPALVSAAKAPRGWVAALVLAALSMAPSLLSTAIDEDALVYHLALPWQCLESHRFSIEGVSFLFHLPLPVDLTYVVPILLGDDRLAKWEMATAYAAIASFVAGRLTGPEVAGARWLTSLLALSGGFSLVLPGLPKNDPGMLALFVLGAILWRDQRSPAGALLLGGAIAAKLSCGPLAAAWVLMHPPRSQRTAVSVAALLVPTLPWLLKAWLATGDPVFPVLWRAFRTPFWSPVNQASLDDFGMWVPDAGVVRTLPLACVRELWRNYPQFLVGLLFCFLRGSRRSSVALSLGFLGVLYVGRLSRYLLPGIWLEAAMLTEMIRRIDGGRRNRFAGAAACLCLALIWHHAQPGWLHWRDLVGGAAERRGAFLTTYGEAVTDLGQLGSRRILATGGWRSYLVPSRVLFNGFWGDTPLIWSAVHSSTSEERLRRRFRQFGDGTILQNVVSGDLVSWRQRYFTWDDRMLVLYRSFCGHRLSVVRAPRRADRANGGFYVVRFDLSPAGGGSVPNPFFLPGAESAIVQGRVLTQTRRFGEAEREFRRVLSVAPNVGFYVTHFAQVYTESGRWDQAYHLLAPFAKAGLIDGYNLPTLGEAAAMTGRLDEAERVFRRCLDIYDTVAENRINLAWTYQARARVSMAGGRWAAAQLDCERAERVLAGVPEGRHESYEHTRRETAVLVAEVRASLQEGRSAAKSLKP